MPSSFLPPWLRTRNVGVALIGFGLNCVSSFGAAFWLNPAQDANAQAAQAASMEAARSRAILSANSAEFLAQHMSGLVFGVTPPQTASDAVRDAIHELRMRELERRHDGVRAYLAQLGVAGAIDYPMKLAQFDKLAAAEDQDFTLENLRASNAFENSLAADMVGAQGAAAMKSNTLQADSSNADAIVAFRKLTLLAISLLGSSVLFVAAMIGAKPDKEVETAEARILRRVQSLVAAGGGRSR